MSSAGPLVESEAHCDPFLEFDIAHANYTFNHGPNRVNVLDSYIFRQRWSRRDVTVLCGPGSAYGGSSAQAQVTASFGSAGLKPRLFGTKQFLFFDS